MTDERKIEELLRSVIDEMPWSDEAVEIFMRSAPEHPMPEAMKARLLENLLEAQKERARIIERLENPEKLNSFGEFIIITRKRRGLNIGEFSGELGIPYATLEHLEKNDIPIVDVPLQEMKIIIKNLSIKLRIAFALIRKSSALFGYRPNYLHGMARFDTKKSTGKSKNQSMKRAFEELHLRKKTHKRDEKLEHYLESLEREMSRG